MDRRQRLDDPTTNFDALKRATKGEMWTALPGIIQSFNEGAMTCEVQPSIQGVNINAKTTAMSFVNLPLLTDCPVCFPGWGGATMTFPVAAGDECLIVFSSRCIDAWWQNGGVQQPLEYRMHDLSDGFVLPGGRSQPRVISGISTTDAQLRSDDGSTLIGLNPTAQTLTVIAPGGFNFTGTMNVTGDIVLNGISLTSHVHSGVETGTGVSGEMVA